MREGERERESALQEGGKCFVKGDNVTKNVILFTRSDPRSPIDCCSAVLQLFALTAV
jgi:hypothetical protein